MQRLALGANHICLHRVPTEESCESPIPNPSDAAADPKHFGDLHSPLQPRAGAGEGRLTPESRMCPASAGSPLPLVVKKLLVRSWPDSGPPPPPTACVALPSCCTCLPASSPPPVAWSSPSLPFHRGVLTVTGERVLGTVTEKNSRAHRSKANTQWVY